MIPEVLALLAEKARLQRRRASLMSVKHEALPIVPWLQANYLIPETGQPVNLAPHQVAVLEYAFQRDANGRFRFNTVLIGQPKKSGKSAISGGIGRWASETWGRYGEVYYMGNDAEQARERGFKAHKTSIQLHPSYNRRKEYLEGQWLIQTDRMMCLTSGTQVKALSCDYAGEAGANPILTIWEELWGFIHKDALRFWAELAPSPTRLNSMRLVVTYAGYEGESELLTTIYNAGVREGRRLTAGELGHVGCFAEATDPGAPVPCYVNENARLFAFWDEGERAHRMPWQQGERGREYYASEAATQTPQQFRRLHLNEWVSGESEFVPIHWWDACKDGPAPIPAGDLTPYVIALDAAVTGDCFALTMGRRVPPANGNSAERVRPVLVRKWEPPGKGEAIDFRQPEALVRDLCERFNVVEVCYDAYQLHDLCTRLRAEGVANFQEFSQSTGRLESDTLLYQLIANRRIVHGGEPELREHIQNCNAKLSKDEDNKLRLIKKAENRKIDLAVCLSMMSYELLRLNL